MLRVNRAGWRPDASAAGAVVIGLVIGSPLWPAAGAGFVNWPGYLHDPAHTSMSQATAITTIALDSHAFSQPVFADRYLFVGTGRSLTAWAA